MELFLRDYLPGALFAHRKSTETKFINKLSDPGKFKKAGNIEKWSLGLLIEAATELDLIGPRRVHFLKAIQDFRNFIHPYNLSSQSIRPNERLARMALDAVHFAVESLQKRVGRIT